MTAVKWPHAGINRRALESILLELGGTIDRPRRTGEVVYRHRLVVGRVCGNGRRKDSTREQVAFVQRAYREVERFAVQPGVGSQFRVAG